MYLYHVKSDSKTEVPMKIWKFPGGEVGVKFDIPNEVELFGGEFELHVLMPDSAEIQAMFQIMSIIDREVDGAKLTIHMPYLPYARQDRICNPGEAFALHIFVDQLQYADTQAYNTSVNFVFEDLHSQVARDLLTTADINWEERMTIYEHALDFLEIGKIQNVVFPDAGAMARYKPLVTYIETNLPQVGVHYLTKTRQDGKVCYDSGSVPEFSGTAVIIDDICDGGATFISIADALHAKNPDSKLTLLVTHGIFSRGVEVLDMYENVVAVYNHSQKTSVFA